MPFKEVRSFFPPYFNIVLWNCSHKGSVPSAISSSIFFFSFLLSLPFPFRPFLFFLFFLFLSLLYISFLIFSYSSPSFSFFSNPFPSISFFSHFRCGYFQNAPRKFTHVHLTPTFKNSKIV